MIDDKSLLDLCLQTSGSFENGKPSYSALTGNDDGQGISCGILQWAAGQGSLQTLLQLIGTNMGWQKAQTFFSSDIEHFAYLKPADAIEFCLDHYIASGSTKLDPAAAAKWVDFLNQPESIAAQVQLATTVEVARSKSLVAKYCSESVDKIRPYAFFFDVITQEGGMIKHGVAVPVAPLGNAAWQPALDLAHTKDLKCAGIWESILNSDQLAQQLMYYAYARANMGNPLYVWDALSRRGTIACRSGIVHKGMVNLTAVLD